VRNILDTTGAGAGAGQVDELIGAVITWVRLEDENNRGDRENRRDITAAAVADECGGDGSDGGLGSIGDGGDEGGCDSLDVSHCSTWCSNSNRILSNDRARLSDDISRQSNNVSRQGNDISREGNSSAGSSDGSTASVDINVDDQKNISSDILASSKSTTTSWCGVSTTALNIISSAGNVAEVIILTISVIVIEDFTTVASSKKGQPFIPLAINNVFLPCVSTEKGASRATFTTEFLGHVATGQLKAEGGETGSGAEATE
jgi:hypothetical protein